MNSETLTLLPLSRDEEGDGNHDGELKRLNLIMKLNNEQIMSLLKSYASDNIKLRAVVKDGKVVGFRMVNEGVLEERKKVEIIKCNSIKENVGSLYHKISNGGNAVNLGQLDYRMSLINHKPNVTEDDIKEVTRFREVVKIVEFVASHVDDEEFKISNSGLTYNTRIVLKEFGGNREQIIKTRELLNKLKPMDEGNCDTIAWKWLKLLRSFNNKQWIKQLFMEGYRPNDTYAMLYSGYVDPDLISKRQNSTDNDSRRVSDVESAVYSDSGPTSPLINTTSAKSSVSSISNNSPFSRSNSNSSGSRHTTPAEDEKDEVKEVKKTKRSFKEYQLSKGISAASASATPEPQQASNHHVKKAADDRKRKIGMVQASEDGNDDRKNSKNGGNNHNHNNNNNNCDSSNNGNVDLGKIPKGPKGPKKAKPNADETELVKQYQGIYVEYFKLYENLKGVETRSLGNDEDKIHAINGKIKKLIDMQNELERLRFMLVTE